jgi:hypothetical protein
MRLVGLHTVIPARVAGTHNLRITHRSPLVGPGSARQQPVLRRARDDRLEDTASGLVVFRIDRAAFGLLAQPERAALHLLAAFQLIHLVVP